MHEKRITRAEPPLTFLERMDARVKIVCVLTWVICVASLRTRPAALDSAYCAIIAVLLVLNPRNIGRFARRFGAALPIVAALCVLLPFFKAGTVVWEFGPVEVTREGLAIAARVGTTALLCVAAVCLLWATTTEADLVSGLRGVGVPAVLVGVFAFMLRYLHVLRPELHRLWDARSARMLGTGGPPLRSAMNLVGAFFLRAHDRAALVADAMAARGFDGTWRRISGRTLRPGEVTAGLAFATAILILRARPWS